jgi:predicted nucleic acid-binding protein
LIAYVIDASVAVKWVVEEPLAAEAEAVRDGGRLIAPDLWLAECANILWKKQRRGELAPRDAEDSLAALRDAGVRLTPSDALATRALQIAMALDHPAYDGFYLALAEETGRPLVTADGRLLQRVAEQSTLARLVRPLAQFTPA